MDDNNKDGSGGEPFLSRYDAPELRVAAEFLTTWFPFLSADLCPGCARTLSNRIRSLVPGDPFVAVDTTTMKRKRRSFCVL